MLASEIDILVYNEFSAQRLWSSAAKTSSLQDFINNGMLPEDHPLKRRSFGHVSDVIWQERHLTIDSESVKNMCNWRSCEKSPMFIPALLINFDKKYSNVPPNFFLLDGIKRHIQLLINREWGLYWKISNRNPLPLRFSRKDRTFHVNKLFIIWFFALVLQARNRPVGITRESYPTIGQSERALHRL